MRNNDNLRETLAVACIAASIVIFFLWRFYVLGGVPSS